MTDYWKTPIVVYVNMKKEGKRVKKDVTILRADGTVIKDGHRTKHIGQLRLVVERGYKKVL